MRCPSCTTTTAAFSTGRPSAATVPGLPPGTEAPETDTYDVGLDVAYVAMHHLSRLGIVILGAQIVFKTQKGWRKT